MNAKERAEWRELCRAAINEQDPNRLSDIIQRVNELIEVRKKHLAEKKQKAASA